LLSFSEDPEPDNPDEPDEPDNPDEPDEPGTLHAGCPNVAASLQQSPACDDLQNKSQ